MFIIIAFSCSEELDLNLTEAAWVRFHRIIRIHLYSLVLKLETLIPLLTVIMACPCLTFTTYAPVSCIAYEFPYLL
jgi:hypothetical protein